MKCLLLMAFFFLTSVACSGQKDFELTGDTDDDYRDCASEDSELVTFPCGTWFSDYEDEVVFEQPCDSFNVEELALPFIEGGRLTRGNAYMMLLDIALNFGLSWTAIEEIQKLFNNLLERKAFSESRLHLADTKGNLDERKRLHVVCDMCRTQYSGTDLVRAGSFFVSIPIKKQLASILSSKTVGSAVMSSLICEHSSESAMNDVTDGAHYQKVRQNMDKSDITVTVNSGGSPVFNSSSYSIWPIQLALNELPPRLRWNNIMTPVLWYGKEHPDMTLVLQAFVRQLEELNKTGLRWEFADTVVKSKVFCICCADSPARAAMQHMVQFNGYYGCSWCYHPGVNVDGTVKYCLSTPFPDRTDEEAVQDMRDACNSGAAVRGVKGPSPFINLLGLQPYLVLEAGLHAQHLARCCPADHRLVVHSNWGRLLLW
ncbi:hypothetical protein MTO96_027913 [Rhipicephalus appendiculatus]